MKNLKKTKYLFISALIVFFAGISPAVAGNLGNAFEVSDGSNDDPLDSAADQAGYDTGQTDPTSIISTIIQVALSFVGIIFLVLMIYGGFLWMTARGNEEQAGKAKKLIVAAFVGLVIVVSAYAIAYFVMAAMGGSTLS